MMKHYGVIVSLVLSFCCVLSSEYPDPRLYIQVDRNSTLFAQMVEIAIAEGQIASASDSHKIQGFVLRSDLDELENQARWDFQRELVKQELIHHFNTPEHFEDLERLDREIKQEVAEEQKIVLQDRALQSKQKKQQQKYYPKTNNRNDRPKHAQVNMRIQQPQYRANKHGKRGK